MVQRKADVARDAGANVAGHNEGAGRNRFGELIRRHRLAAGVSQQYLAEHSRLSTAAVSSLERGARQAPYRYTVALLAEALSLSNEQRSELEVAAQRGRARNRQSAGDASAAHNLPTQLTSFVGRVEQIEQIIELFERHRLVSITGSGGVGKTRLALEVAARLLEQNFRSEVRFVDLAPVHEATFMTGRMAAVLGISVEGRRDPVAAFAAAVRDRRMLLIIDNCEHLLAEVASATQVILQQCPHVAILTTSRERLGMLGEVVYRLAALPLPARNPQTVSEARSFAALELFVQRASAVDPRFALTRRRISAVTDICRRLDGIPLAIELAVGRLPLLGLVGLGTRIRESFVLAGGSRDLPARQQTMRATITWSYELLNEHERILLRRLAIFAGGFTLEAAENVCQDEQLSVRSIADLLSALADKSLVNVELKGEATRYALLESVRAFALERLEQTEGRTPQARRHARWLADLADEQEPHYGAAATSMWLPALVAEIDNVRAALEWALTGGEADAVLAGRIIGGLRGMWIETGRFTECTRWAEAAIAKIDESHYPWIALRLWRALLQTRTGAPMFEAVQRTIPLAEAVRSPLLPLAYSHLANELCWYGRLEEADQALGRALSIFIEMQRQRSPQYPVFLAHRAWHRTLQGRLDEARADLADGEELAADLSEDLISSRYAWFSRRLVSAEIECCEGRPQRAIQYAEEALKRALESASGGRAIGGIFCHLSGLRFIAGDLDGAESAGRDAIKHARSTISDRIAYWAIQHLAGVRAARGRAEVAAQLCGLVDAWCAREGYHRGPIERQSCALLAAYLQKHALTPSLETMRTLGMRLSLDEGVELALYETSEA